MNIASRGIVNDARFPKQERHLVAIHIDSPYFTVLQYLLNSFAGNGGF
jgi:hypothetical protein